MAHRTRARRWLAFGLAALTALSGVACDYDDGGGGAGEGEQQQQDDGDGGEDGGGDTGY